ncbi:MAG: single-stranded-DNA-specific exonuclease RecJ [Desulfarculaceae bacterium]|nr:single-stranded-DNA-specific exonuclease RecJ [Desulfarculaceae bacterium]MCF8071461.1 single-stranded-DNA-specific exonuclease RecJ [Desulfarculaceae bacterium]MCF8103411.1 single-stranded-DNA-specific exonuclease RecJ [Desulfarculaceae bacterium]MCF8118182.1 single-stranded-DNA-specific exonuclease RecJ [Desulfarculaceae bacterium]
MVPSPPPLTWRVKEPTPSAAAALSRALGLPPLAAQLLCHRGYSDPDDARRFLSPELGQLPSPEEMLGLPEAIEVLVPAIKQGACIGVAGDYDADGVTATALLQEFFAACGCPVVHDLPHRLSDGYGFKPPRAKRLAEAGAQVIVTADCGISDHEGVAEATRLGLPVVVSDHHLLPPGPLVPAAAVVNPKQDACRLSNHLAGVGVAFYLAAGLRAALRTEGWFDGRSEPNLRHSLDLVALGTCADVVPLVEANRVLVAEGLKVLAEGRRPGLTALAKAAGRSGVLDTMDLGFYLAPRINAAGRLDHPEPALRLLLADSPAEAKALAQDLNQLNSERREVEAAIFEQVLERVGSEEQFQGAGALVLGSENWHQGVLGIVAGRLLERTGRPSMLFAMQNGTAVGSGRSREGFHLQRALAANAGLLEHFGGHALAAGATMPSAKLPELAAALAQAAAEELPAQQSQELLLEGEVSLAELGPGMMEPLNRLAPYGQANPEPLLAARGAEVVSTRVVGDNHLKMKLIQDGTTIPAIAFNCSESWIKPGAHLDLAFIPRISTFGRTHLELVVKDLRDAS